MRKAFGGAIFAALSLFYQDAVSVENKESDKVLIGFNSYLSDLEKDKPIAGYFAAEFLEEKMDLVDRANADIASVSLEAVRKTIRFGERIRRILNRRVACDITRVCTVSVDFCTPYGGFNNYQIYYRQESPRDDLVYKIFKLELLLDKSKSAQLCN